MKRLCGPVVEGGVLGVLGRDTLICSMSHRIALYRITELPETFREHLAQFFSLDYISLLHK